jgi:hypothetical protein
MMLAVLGLWARSYWKFDDVAVFNLQISCRTSCDEDLNGVRSHNRNPGTAW